MRCANEHYVPDGFDHCRRCADAHLMAPAMAGAGPAAVLTVGQYVAQRDRVMVLDAAIVSACTVAVAGRSPAALGPAIVVGLLALVAARLFVRAASRPATDEPASAVHVRRLERLMLTPAVVIVLTAVVAFARW